MMNRVFRWTSSAFCLFFFVSISAQDTLVKVIAKKGDGILSLLREQGLNPYEAYDDFIVMNIENLRDSVNLYEGRSYTIPPMLQKSEVMESDADLKIADSKEVAEKEVAEKEVDEKKIDSKGVVENVEKKAEAEVATKEASFSLFGKEHALVLPKSEKLKDAIYYLVSGHGGPDPGAMATYGNTSIAEDEYAYDITLRLAKELMAHGAKVYVVIQDLNDGIRNERILEIDHDEVAYGGATIPLKQIDRLKQRVAIVNQLYKKNKGKYQRLIVTHVDSRSEGQNIDVFFYHHKKSRNGKKLAESVHKTFQKKYKKYQPNRTYSGTFEDRTNLYLVKNTWPAMTFIEVGNIRNTKDQRRILDPDNRQALAKWISEGLLLDFKIGEL